MFGRKRSETEDRSMADSADDLGIPMKPARPAGSSLAVTPGGRTPAAVPPRVPEMARNAPEPAPAPASEAAQRRVTEPIGMPVSSPAAAPSPAPALTPRRAESEARRLTVGREIALSGEIASCDTLVVEGSVLFKGSATIDHADVRGTFEGNLVVRKRLLIRATGQVSGTIRYGQIEIELGGQISGDVQAIADSDVIAELPNARAAS
jgi:hypothetical protein